MARASDPPPGRSPIETALRHLGARRYGNPVELIEHAIRRPSGRTGTLLAPLAEPTSVLGDWTAVERARALWSVIEEGIVDPQVSSTPQSRRRRALQAAFRLPDDEIGQEWGASLTERFKQLKALRIFGDVTSIQPMEISWKRGVERLAAHLEERLGELATPDDWAPYRPVNPESPAPGGGATIFRRPSEGAQKLVVNLFVLTVINNGGVERRISERLITSRDDQGLRYYTARSYTYSQSQGHTYMPTHALWGCEAERVDEDGLPVTRLWFPRPLRTGDRAHFVSEAVHEVGEDDGSHWTNVDIDHYGIEPGEVRDGMLPVRGLTIRIRFERDSLPTSAWWYGEQNEPERYVEPPAGSPRRLEVVGGDVVKTFEQPCQPRESYGIGYRWSSP